VKRARLVTVAAVIATTGTFVVAVPAAASAATGRDFGQHVRTCVDTVVFGGDYNPGMHSGYAGWDGMVCQA
jgi:hypothetical protein